MQFSWWAWSGIMAILVMGTALIVRAIVMAVRTDGIGRARAERGPSAPWFWSGIGVLVVAGVLLFFWVRALDG